MFDSAEVMRRWAIARLEEHIEAEGYRGIVSIHYAYVSIEEDYVDRSDCGYIGHVCQDDCLGGGVVINISGVGHRSSGSQIRLSREIPADSFDFISFLDQIQEHI